VFQTDVGGDKSQAEQAGVNRPRNAEEGRRRPGATSQHASVAETLVPRTGAARKTMETADMQVMNVAKVAQRVVGEPRAQMRHARNVEPAVLRLPTYSSYVAAPACSVAGTKAAVRPERGG